jgi:hypothetical protein
MDYVVLNYASSNNSKINADQIDTSIPANIWNELSKNDNEPYFSIVSIPYPVAGNTHLKGVKASYDEPYFMELEESVKKAPIPGSNDGHSESSKPHNDFFTVGVKTVSNGDGTGVAHFKNYIPPTDWEGKSQSGLIRDAKIGIINYSLVSSPKYDIKQTVNGKEYHVIGTNGSDRNDAVEKGAMLQTVNEKENYDFGLMRDLVKNGQVTLENIDGSIIQNGKVSRPALRQIVSRADCENKAEISELISMIDKTKNGGKPVELKEAIEMVGVAVKNGAVPVTDIAKNCGFVIRNAQDEENAKIIENMKAKLGDEMEKKLDTIIAENSANAEAIVMNKVIAVYGQEKNGDIENPAYVYAMDKCKGKNSADVDALLVSLKDDSIMKMIASKNADMTTTAVVLNSTDNVPAKNKPVAVCY